MSQNDLTIANQGFASFRSDLNSALQALGSTNSGTSAPSTTFANQLFYDTTNNILKIRNEDNDAFISLFTLDQANDNIESLTVSGLITSVSLNVTGAITAFDGMTITTADNTSQLSLVSTDADASFGPELLLFRNSASPADNDAIGQVKFQAKNSNGDTYTYAEFDATLGDVTDGTEDGQLRLLISKDGTLRQALSLNSTTIIVNDAGQDIDFRVEGDTQGNLLRTDAGNDRVGIHIGTPSTTFQVGAGSADTRSTFAPNTAFAIALKNGSAHGGFIGAASADQIKFSSSGGAERMRIGSNILIGTTNNSPAEGTTTGTRLGTNGGCQFSTSGLETARMNRVGDGNILTFAESGSVEGAIAVSGTTVSLNGGHLSRWSRLSDNSKDTSIVKGTVMTNLDDMVEWGDEDNEQLNKMAISSVEGDSNVAGVFVSWDNDDDWNDMMVAMTGDMVIRIAKDTTVSRGDLLMSAGDGTAKTQSDDIVRSKTIAKVTSTNKSHTYDDGTYLVPCVLMAC